ncbi:tyrosine-protein phosphatase [Egibacter rhizosphaerae]|uniref:Tyrosine-protein phosphatase n=1 Tax=Egibacter rhizosphaerae TaxID=1670831 RepID=A0A411YFA1_9ACTN|nr:tyrosine-protein phosphatase [Egibacter rhizosphaerae]QBI19792.1 tyrosine-protein phosphatase [Egibacter rhizosphaerae]
MTTLDVALPSLPNLRDLGGLPTRDGGRIRPGVLLRSESPSLAEPHDAVALADRFGVTDVIDLRRDDEAERKPLPPALADRVQRHAIPFAVEAPPHVSDAMFASDEIRPADVGRYYAWMASENVAQLRAVAARVADADGAVLVHCAIGKDRTGVTTALTLLGVGVEERLVIDDYVRSHAAMRMTLPRHDPELTADDIDRDVRLGAPAEVLAAFLAALGEEHGSADGFWHVLDPEGGLRAALDRRLVTRG